MMQYMILTAIVLVLCPKKRLKAAKLVDMAIPANGSKNKAEPVDTPVRAQYAGCDSYELYGSRYKGMIQGWYSKTSHTCSSKPVYSRYIIDFGETVYLFYNSGHWAFSRTRCSSTSYVASASILNNFPDEVVSWKEVDTSGNWYKNPDIGVKCSSDTSANINPLVVLILLVCGCVATW